MFIRKCKITFIRHGATINTEENRLFDDETYPAININGKTEMEEIGLYVAQTGGILPCGASTFFIGE